jgi:hypothetical protein
MPKGDGSWTYGWLILLSGIKVNDIRKRRFLIIIRNRLFYINDHKEGYQTTLFLMELLSLTSGSITVLDERLTGDKSPSASPNA